MREIIDLMKEILLLKKEDSSVVGLMAFKRKKRTVLTKPKKKVKKEVKLSDLMRRA